MNGKSRREYLKVIYSRYRRAELEEKQVILNEFCRNTGYNRKYAIRLLNAPAPNPRRERARRRRRSPTYSAGVIAVLGAVWEAAGHPCAVRLKALLPLWRPWVRKRFRPTAATEKGVLDISARQIDRRLAERKKRVSHRLYGRTKPGTLLQQPDSPPHRPLAGEETGLRGSGSGFAFGQIGQRRVRLRAQFDRCAHGLDRDAGHSGQGPPGRVGRFRGDSHGPALSLAGDQFGQWLGVHQLARRRLVRSPPSAVLPQPPLQEGRQRLHRAEELDARAQTNGLGSLRHRAGRGSHE